MSGLTTLKLGVVLLLGGAAALVAGLLLGQVLRCGVAGACSTGSVGQVQPAEARGAAGARLVRVSGDTSRPLTPGRTVPLDLRLSNPHRLVLTAGDLRVTVRGIDAPASTERRRCTRADFRIDQAATGLRVTLPARGSTTLRTASVPPSQWPRITMLDRPVNQDGCKGASLRLGYSLSGSEVLR